MSNKLSIDDVLTRGVAEVLPSKEGLAKLMAKGKIRLYQGFDPTGDKLHIGHAVGFRKLRQFQDLGHEVIFLIGDGTGQAGDPSGKKTAREKFFTTKELRENGKNYVMQASKIIRFDGPNPVKIMYNGDWLNKLSLTELLDIASHFTLQQMLERDLYQERLRSRINLSIREFFYPLLQGYDSVAMKVDLELGGTDQVFNMLAGRKLVKNYLNKEKYVMTVPLLTDSHGNKIGKSEGNVIGLTDKPGEFYGKIMALGDDTIQSCFELLTDRNVSKSEVDKNPLKYKKQLAFELTAWLNSESDAKVAQEAFEQTFQKRQTPEVIQLIKLSQTRLPLLDLIFDAKLAPSRSEAKRLIKNGAVDVGDKTITDPQEEISLSQGIVVKIGKKKFVKVNSK